MGVNGAVAVISYVFAAVCTGPDVSKLKSRCPCAKEWVTNGELTRLTSIRPVRTTGVVMRIVNGAP